MRMAPISSPRLALLLVLAALYSLHGIATVMFGSFSKLDDNYSSSSSSGTTTLLLDLPTTTEFLVSDNANTTTTTASTTNSKRLPRPALVAYAISITSCDSIENNILQGAAVLQHSIQKQSLASRQPTYRQYKLYAFVKRNATHVSCRNLLERMGYTLLEKDTPIRVEDIRDPTYRELVGQMGCCGADEFIKLYSYTLMEHSVVVHLDVDTWLLQPLDDVLDVMTLTGAQRDEAYKRLDVMRRRNNNNDPLPEQQRVDAMFTHDYGQVHWHHRLDPPSLMPMQGGFFVVRPDLAVFEELKSLVLDGNFTKNGGWGDLGYGKYYGGPQIQGLFTYYYYHIRNRRRHPNKRTTFLELHHCYYNTVLNHPFHRNGQCVTSEDDGKCEDCIETDIAKVKLVHPLLCGKIWKCKNRFPQCGPFTESWFALRYELEQQWSRSGVVQWNRTDAIMTDGDSNKPTYCRDDGRYLPMKFTESSLLPQ